MRYYDPTLDERFAAARAQLRQELDERTEAVMQRYQEQIGQLEAEYD